MVTVMTAVTVMAVVTVVTVVTVVADGSSDDGDVVKKTPTRTQGGPKTPIPRWSKNPIRDPLHQVGKKPHPRPFTPGGQKTPTPRPFTPGTFTRVRSSEDRSSTARLL
jgi:hypothetical protein